MFGSSSPSPPKDTLQEPDSGTTTIPPTTSTEASTSSLDSTTPSPPASEQIPIKDKRGGSSPGNGRPSPDKDTTGAVDKKRRSSGVGNKASAFLASAKNSLHFSPSSNSTSFRAISEQSMQTPLQKLGMKDPALSVPQGTHNNSAGESVPGPRSTFRVGVWEDKNKKCRRTMEDTHAFLYNFLCTPAPSVVKLEGPNAKTATAKNDQSTDALLTASASDLELGSTSSKTASDMMETDNGYFAIFDGHAGTFAADWCGKKLHIILEELIRKNPNAPVPEMLDQTFTSVDNQLEQLPLKNSGCTAVAAVLRWEDRIPNSQSATGYTAMAHATKAATKAAEESTNKTEEKVTVREDPDRAKELAEIVNPAADLQASAAYGLSTSEAAHARLKNQATRQRVLYTANVGDARIVLCRAGRALRLSYDHKGSDENETKRIVSAGGLILNNRVNGVLAVTRALGDAYMKELVTGHPYTTETVIQPDFDEFIILACDGLWDVCSDQEAVELVRSIQDPVAAAKTLVDHALARFSTDNLSCMIVRLNRSAILDTANNHLSSIGVEGDPVGGPGRLSEADKLVAEARRKAEEEGVQCVGVSGSNSGKGHEQRKYEDDPNAKTSSMEKVVEEEAATVAPVAPVAPGEKTEVAKEMDVNVGVLETTSPEEAEDMRK
ncbi:hypothetical protein V493_05819 [Pseudogymnoascus sp. VKM F-4281 (FW-2241)]|nr:hypothetical protein V493_05819 [Pseudogymnoascus sp. VKM F-4281 (FW-2241)]